MHPCPGGAGVGTRRSLGSPPSQIIPWFHVDVSRGFRSSDLRFLVLLEIPCTRDLGAGCPEDLHCVLRGVTSVITPGLVLGNASHAISRCTYWEFFLKLLNCEEAGAAEMGFYGLAMSPHCPSTLFGRVYVVGGVVLI